MNWMDYCLCQLILLQNGIFQIYDINLGDIFWNSIEYGNINVSWILKVDLYNGIISVGDIMNSFSCYCVIYCLSNVVG